MRQYVKVKCVSLADEAKLIVKYENQRLASAAKARKQGKPERADYHFANYWGMRQHRVNDIRKEARIANVAYGFMKGKAYNQIERNSYTQPNWDRIRGLVSLYGEGDYDTRMARYDTWEMEALAGQERLKTGGVKDAKRLLNLSAEHIQPRSFHEVTNWLLRYFQGNFSAWMQWLRQTHPLPPKKKYLGETTQAPN